ncbi:MAG: hypothetical protein QMD05_04705 [Candidatus Brocadiaceae bacterium]|nr:hypothetical protein [Candidatus Brocadiaceae bacterium]
MNKLISLAAVMSLFILFSHPAGAVWTKLTEEQTNLAIAYGKTNKEADYLTFFKEWRVDLGYGKGAARVITPFSKVAFEAKNSPFEHVKLTPDDINKLLEELKDRLAFGVSLYGDELDFAKDCHAVLKHKGQTIKPVEERHDKIAESTKSWPQSPAYRAICYYYFDLHRVDPNSTVTLEVSTSKGRPVEFTFDLSKIK